MVPQPAAAQTQAPFPAYWQYLASGQLQHIVVDDVDFDGISDFIVVDETGKIDMVQADGTEAWSYVAPGPVLAAGTANVDGPDQPEPEIVIALANELILLSAAGEEIWRADVASVDPPVSLLTAGGQEELEAWLARYPATAAKVGAHDQDGDGFDEILLLLDSGRLLLYDGTGNLLWQQVRHSQPALDLQPQLIIDDFDGNGLDDIVYSVFNPRRFSQIVLTSDAEPQWEVALSGRVTALESIQFTEGGEALIAAGTSLGHLYLYDGARERVWFRTLNTPITDLAVVDSPQGRLLVAATEVGGVVAFDKAGRRVWSAYLAEAADRSIVSLTTAAAAAEEGQPALAAIVEPLAGTSESADVMLLASTGQTLDQLTDVDTLGLTRLTDVNHDHNSELLVARFATLELLSLGSGNNVNSREWEYSLNAEPLANIVVDLDQDGLEELVVGTRDGRIHAIGNDRAIRWLHDPGGAITHLALLADGPGNQPAVVVVRNLESRETGQLPESWIELRQANGEKIWERQMPATISAVVVADLDGGAGEIVAGTSDGSIYAYSAVGEPLWSYSAADLRTGVEHIFVLPGTDERALEIVVSSQNRLVGITPKGEEFTSRRITTLASPIKAMYPVQQPGNELAIRFVVLEENGQVHALNWRGIELAHLPWPQQLGGAPLTSIVYPENRSPTATDAVDSFLIASDSGQLERLDIADNLPTISWRLEDLAEITSMSWIDQDGDERPDIAMLGSRDGRVRVYREINSREPELAFEFDVASAIADLAILQRGLSQSPDLLVIAENGVVQLFRDQENHPPLLVNPVVETRQGQYNISVQVQDVDGDEVTVGLELLDPVSNQWLALEPQSSTSNGQLFWPATNPPVGSDGVAYRFHFNDGFYSGYVLPNAGPKPIPSSPLASAALLASLILLSVGGLAIVVVNWRQGRQPDASARRFYRRLKDQPQRSLTLVADRYIFSEGSPDFLLHLANRARQEGDVHIADLADGLFLLPSRAQAAGQIILRALGDIAAIEPAWEGSERWLLTFKTGQALLEAPTILELSLAQPQLKQLLDFLEESDQWSPVLAALLPVLTNLRDSERVEQAVDRLVYLSEAESSLEQLQEQLPEFAVSIELTLTQGIITRWSGLVSAAIEELRGRAELIVTLNTKRLVPNGRTDLAITISNGGQSPAENIIAVLDEDPAYRVHSRPQVIPFLPSGRSRQINFAIEPIASDRFRISLGLTFDDHNQRDKEVAFGDMVHILPPVRDYTTVANPYVPGSPLRPGSGLFYGREELFSFIAANTQYRSSRNALILVGQRRTGKTSVLLRLNENLPEQLLPVYIDCQSLGVVPGMAPLLQELAWHIADAMSARDLALTVKDLEDWQQDPVREFQRSFLPAVRAALPDTYSLVLVFDEFEAFESLVEDGILPPTFFTYMRHLMQHEEGLNFIFVGTRRLEQMSADYWSVLFNIALYRKIGYLSEEASTHLITEPVAPQLVYDDLALDKILRVTAGHPYFLQLVCYTLVNRANASRTGYVTISDVNAALDEMLSLGEVHFAYLWQRSSFAERALLVAVAHLIDQNRPFHPQDLLQYLQSHRIRVNPAEITTALHRLVERDIMLEVAEKASVLYELKVGLVGLWVAKNKSLSKLQAGDPEATKLLPTG